MSPAQVPRATPRAPPRILISLCVGLLLLTTADEVAATQSSSSARAKRKPQAVKLPLVQTAVLRYTGLLALPTRLRQSLSSDAAGGGLPSADLAQGTCSRTASTASKVEPCLGLHGNGELPSSVRIRFDLALKSIGAPKEVFGPCPVGATSATCNPSLADSLSAQQRLADVLAGQRRYPFATVGLALSF